MLHILFRRLDPLQTLSTWAYVRRRRLHKTSLVRRKGTEGAGTYRPIARVPLDFQLDGALSNAQTASSETIHHFARALNGRETAELIILRISDIFGHLLRRSRFHTRHCTRITIA